jgi:flap endonuclease-1
MQLYFVLDGKSNILKNREKAARKERFQKNVKSKYNKKIIELIEEKVPFDSKDIYIQIQNENKLPYLQKNEVTDIIDSIKSLGCLFIQANSEGEKLCSELCYYGLCDSVISRDSDCIASLCPIIIVNVYFNKDLSCDIIYIENILKILAFTEDEFIDFCILLGTDYNKNIPGIGPNKADKMIREYKSIENIIKSNKYDCENIKNFKEIRSLLFPCSYNDLHIKYI